MHFFLLIFNYMFFRKILILQKKIDYKRLHYFQNFLIKTQKRRIFMSLVIAFANHIKKSISINCFSSIVYIQKLKNCNDHKTIIKRIVTIRKTNEFYIYNEKLTFLFQQIWLFKFFIFYFMHSFMLKYHYYTAAWR